MKYLKYMINRVLLYSSWFYFDPNRLDYRRVRFNPVIMLSLSLFIGSIFGYYFKTNVKILVDPEEYAIIVKEETNKSFSEEKLLQYLTDINIKFPKIVYAQAVLETGNFQSTIFRSNNNLFGMKEAKRRPTVSNGTELNHAYYETWKESVIDYALYQARYLSDVKTEEQYFEYLGKNYAEVPDYVNRVKNVISKIKITPTKMKYENK